MRAFGVDRPRHRGVPRERKRLGRHRLQLSGRRVRPDLRGPLRRHRTERRRRALRRVQQRHRRRVDDRELTAASHRRRRSRTRWSSCSRGGSTSATSTRARRVPFVSGGNGKFPAGRTVNLRAISGHRDTYLTSCPGNAAYRLLPVDCDAASRRRLAEALHADRLRRARRAGSLHGAPELRAAVDGDGLRRDRRGRRDGAGSGANVDWTWDARYAIVGAAYTWTISAGADRAAGRRRDRRQAPRSHLDGRSGHAARRSTAASFPPQR